MKVSVIYRENDLYQKYVPMFLAAIENCGHEIGVVKVFPREAERAEVDNAIRAFLGGKDSILLHDFVGRTGGSQKRVNIDWVLVEAVSRSFLGDEYDRARNEWQEYDLDSTIAAFKEFFPWAVQRILEKNRPGKIYISEDRILDHSPFCYVKKAGGTEADACDMLVELLEQVGISRNMVIFTDAPADEKGMWVIQDRHSRKEYSESTILQLPLPNFFKTAAEAGFLECEITDEAVKEALERWL